MTTNRGENCRLLAEKSDSSNNERAAWLAAGNAWDTLQIPKPPLSERGRELAALYSMSRLLAAVPTAQAPEEPPTSTPEPPTREPPKPPTPAGAYASIEF